MKDRAPALEVKSQSGAYAIRFVDLDGGAAAAALGTHVMCDRFFGAAAQRSGVPVIAVEASEKTKSLDAMMPLVVALRDHGASRDAHLVAIGGGVVQDAATFVASIFMRGIAWTYVPTTLMAMADSCIGGKSSINVGPYKNLVGNFHPPRTVVIDPAFAKTLSIADMCSGLVEAVKICFCRGGDAFTQYLELAAPIVSGDRDPVKLTALLRHVLAAKIWFIEIDEFDKKERRFLNFGHTWGHALEAATDFGIPHGLAVGVGMLAAAEYAGVDPAPLREHTHALLRAASSTPIVTKYDEAKLLRAFKSDKKHRTDAYRLILPSRDGGVIEASAPKDENTERAFRGALDSALGAIW